MPALRSSLDCKDAESWLSAWLDAELAEDDRALLEQHLDACRTCRDKGAVLVSLKDALKRGALLHQGAPARLVEAVRGTVRVQARRDAAWRVARGATALVVVVVAGVAVAALLPGVFGPAGPLHLRGAAAREDRLLPVVKESAARHALDVPVDVASPDPTRVAAFLRPRVGHDIAVPRLEGYGLLGGRIVDVVNRRAAQLVYMGGLGRRVSVLAVPDPDRALAASLHERGGRRSASADGLPVEVYEQGDVLYTIVGDFEPARLSALVDLLRGSSAPSAAPAAQPAPRPARSGMVRTVSTH